MNTILITGATGFLGKHLVNQLRTVQPDTRLRLLLFDANPWEGDPQIEAVDGDITAPGDVDRVIGGASKVYHLAGFVSRDPKRAELLYRVHIEGTRNICEAALRHGVERVVHVSSSGTIAVSREPTVHDEGSGYKHDVAGRWAYYLSKIFAEKLALSYFENRHLPVVVVNPALLLGPGDDRMSSTGDVLLFLRRQVMASPTGGLSFVDARDAAAGLVGAMRLGTSGQRYLLSGPNWTFREFFEAVGRVSGLRAPRFTAPVGVSLASARLLRRLMPLMGKSFPLDDESIRMAAHFWYCDSSKARAELGFNPRDPFETLRDTVADLRRRLDGQRSR